jgi:hypothetical protein
MAPSVQTARKTGYRRTGEGEFVVPVLDWVPALETYLDQLQGEYRKLLKRVAALETEYRKPASGQ